MPALGNVRPKYLQDMVSYSDIARALEEEKVARKRGQRKRREIIPTKWVCVDIQAHISER